MNKNSIRLGISGDIEKLKQFIQHRTDYNNIYHQAPIRHFSLGIRPWDKIENSLIEGIFKSSSINLNYTSSSP